MRRIALLCGLAMLAANASMSRAESRLRLVGVYQAPGRKFATILLRGMRPADALFIGDFTCRPARRCFAARGRFTFSAGIGSITATFAARARTCEAQLVSSHLGAWQSPTFYSGPVICDGSGAGSIGALMVAQPKSPGPARGPSE